MKRHHHTTVLVPTSLSSWNRMITSRIFFSCCCFYVFYTIVLQRMQPLLQHHHQQQQQHHDQLLLGISFVYGMKHTFYIDHTKHTLIGPIGKPFGYNANGYFKLIVSNFQLQMRDKKKRNKKSDKNKNKLTQQQQQASIWDDYEAGFFLQRYSNLASFHQHYNQLILANSNTNSGNGNNDTGTGTGTVTPITQQCSFAHFLASNDNDDTYDNNNNNNNKQWNKKMKMYRRIMTDITDTEYTDDGDNNVDDDFFTSSQDYDNDNNDEPDDNTLDDIYTNDQYINEYDNNNNQQQQQVVESNTNSKKTTLYYDDAYINDDNTIPSDNTNNNNNNNNKHKMFAYSTAKDGIYLSMKSIEKTWKPQEPFVEYTFKSGEEGLYFLIYQICPKPNITTTILSTFILDIQYYNIDTWGNKSYLPAGEMKLPIIYLYFTISYILCFGLWYTNIRSIQKGYYGLFYKPISSNDQQEQSSSSTSRPVLHHIHQLMTLVILLKLIAMLLESMRYYMKKITGHANVWSILYTIVSCINIFFFFTVIVLLGTGWSIITPFVTGRVKYMIVLVLTLQIVNNIAILFLSQETNGESYYQTWLGVLHIVDILCCCAVVVPIVWQIHELEKKSGLRDNDYDYNDIVVVDDNDTVQHSNNINTNGSIFESDDTDPILNKLKLFRTFYLIVVAYIYSTRILIYLFSSILTYQYEWVEFFIIELVTLTFYVSVGILFRPVPEIHQEQNNKNHINKFENDEDDVISISNDEQQSLLNNHHHHNNSSRRHHNGDSGIELRSIPRSNASNKKV